MIDSTAVLFNLTTRIAFKVRDHFQAIRCEKYCGPHFGDGELCADEPYNGNNSGKSFVNEACYSITMDSESKNNLTNLKCVKGKLGMYFSEFTISELEVWEVIYDK
jgi:hypothetical protein